MPARVLTLSLGLCGSDGASCCTNEDLVGKKCGKSGDQCGSQTRLDFYIQLPSSSLVGANALSAQAEVRVVLY